ncbi:hypothetical protein MM236_10535 [Belliella sp. DSM 107340]|uniref:GDSL-like Lipase/Acylhydrolase n=1 Tax=Belliella calami TaxID=2923436 RepID=A0ABS9UP77_9BACT|nr:hypothetical protein [Belliella calami]MCH7398429.1 hypothetical protein [Belliella calami]
MKIFNKLLYLLVLGSFAACTYEFPEPQIEQPTSGSADFTKIVSVGNSLTAGFMDGALYDRGQQNSFAVILAEQARQVGGGDFNVPEINSVNGFFQMGSQGPLGRLILTVNTQTGAAGPEPIGAGDLPGDFTGNKANLNNFGVPGITLGTALTPLTGGPASPANPAYNRMYERFASNPGTSTIIGDAAAALANGGTFFTFWLGNNDVLGYATGGASNPAILTSDADFQQRLGLALGALLQASSNAKGAVANIPDLNVLPHFNLINPLSFNVPDDFRSALLPGLTQLNQAINGWNNAISNNENLTDDEKAILIRPVLTDNFNQYKLVVADPTLSDAQVPLPNGDIFVIPKIRNLNDSDGYKLPLGARAFLEQGIGISPLAPIIESQHDAMILTPSEQDEIQQKITTFNGFISAAVQANAERLVLVDVNDLLNRVLAGSVSSGGVGLTASIVPPNGGFSLDGVHPNARAHAFVANHFINAINGKWGSNIPLVNPNQFIGNDLPR